MSPAGSCIDGVLPAIAGHDAAEEAVVDLDAALLIRLGEDAVVERRHGLVAGLVAREHLDRRVERLVEQQREERDAQRRDRR